MNCHESKEIKSINIGEILLFKTLCSIFPWCSSWESRSGPALLWRTDFNVKYTIWGVWKVNVELVSECQCVCLWGINIWSRLSGMICWPSWILFKQLLFSESLDVRGGASFRMGQACVYILTVHSFCELEGTFARNLLDIQTHSLWENMTKME